MSEAVSYPAAASVFVSYTRADRPRVAKLAAALDGIGHRLWWDDHLEGGAAFAATIETELARAGTVIACWSAASVASDWVRDEAAAGRDRGVLVPVSLDGTPPPLGFRQYHCIDLAQWDGTAGAPEIAAIDRAIAAARRTSAPVPAGPRPGAGAAIAARSSLAARRWLVAAAAAIIVAIVGIAGWRLADRPPAVAVATADPASIAVLPFANLGGASDGAYLADGLAEELRSTLASFSQLRVAARTSSAAAGKETGGDARAVAARLGVGNVLEGSVQRDGVRIRVLAQLIDAATGFERWSERYDRDAGDAFRVQDDIAREVANALKVRLLLPATPRGRGGTGDATALDAYLRGRAQYDLSGDEATYRRALGHFDAAIAADPGFAAAHAARARTLIVIGNQYSDGAATRRLLAEAAVSAQRSVALAPGLADTQSALGFTLYNQLDFRGAAAAYDRAYKASSGDADQLVRYAGFKYRMGDAAAAAAALDRAATLDPLNPRVPRAQALALMAARRYPDAIAAVGRALALNPAMNGAHSVAGDAWLLEGDAAKARAEYAAEPQEMVRLTGLASAEFRLGNRAAADAALAALIARGGDNSFYQQAQIHAQRGAIDAAMAALARARAVGDTGLVQLKSDPLLDPLRRDQRFTALLAGLNFP